MKRACVLKEWSSIYWSDDSSLPKEPIIQPTRSVWPLQDTVTNPQSHYSKVEKISKGSLDSISLPSPSVKIQIMGGKVCLRCKGKHCWALTTNFLYSKVCWKHPAMFCLYKFPAHNLNFHWRWWNQIRAIFLNLLLLYI